ncbi:neuronal acetylcholine receptor subunit alpha-6-like [Haliotis rufescens]|uniref:neuronal acetylcholine receptor subunit alpha-6-like n=1 Tax=Haliotis rufescens TaxID=6454 RepID=UPI001EB01190|nr:neuronal acetylcholine receptor subunit alpha-6-like [Haliotis rufescens]
MYLVILTLCVFLCATYGRQSGADPGPLYTLYNDLLEHYKPYIRPRKNPNDTVDVVVSYSMTSVEALEETTQSITSSGVIRFEWADELLTWNSSDYGGIQYINIPVDKLWIPDVRMTNALEDISLILPSGDIARVNNDGRIDWYHVMKRRTKCPLDMSTFPFDTQTCNITLFQWITVIAQVNMTAKGVHIESSMFQRNGEWDIIDRSMETIVHMYTSLYIQTEITFTFVFKRKYLYYIITNILPVMLLSILNLGVFLLPPESGEKISLCVSIVVSYAVFLSVIGGSLPQVSDTVCIFSIYLLAMLFVKVATTLLTVLVLNIYHGDTKKECSQPDPKNQHNRSFSEGSERKILKKGNKQLAKLLNKISFAVIFSLTVILTILCFVLSKQ